MDGKVTGAAAAATVDFTDHHPKIQIPAVVAPSVLHVVAQAPTYRTQTLHILFAGLIVRVIADHHIAARGYGALRCAVLAGRNSGVAGVRAVIIINLVAIIARFYARADMTIAATRSGAVV